MRVYEFGKPENPKILLLPGTCCHWRSFAGVLPGLRRRFRVACVSYDGFDETEDTVFQSMEDEVQKIEDYIRKECGGKVLAVYGCSLGGTLVGMLAARARVKIQYGIIGSSDFDTAGRLTARLETALVVKMLYPLMQTGELQGIFRRIAQKKNDPSDVYRTRMMEMFGMGTPRPYIRRESIANQFYTDLITVLPDQIDNLEMQLHVLYAKKMGEKYRKRYEKYIRNPVIHEDNLRHEELLVCYPDKWVERIESICFPGL